MKHEKQEDFYWGTWSREYCIELPPENKFTIFQRPQRNFQQDTYNNPMVVVPV